ncbi:hypothetical protein PUN4_940067 [Paraburkholderia unamae]|nr:hypothetical protein PUN4_940067 [Paraburkholderia unamae]
MQVKVVVTGPAVTGRLPLAATLPTWSVIDQTSVSEAGALVTNATGNAAPEANMRPLCALGVSAETSDVAEAALDVAGEPQFIAPAVTAGEVEPAPLAPVLAVLAFVLAFVLGSVPALVSVPVPAPVAAAAFAAPVPPEPGVSAAVLVEFAAFTALAPLALLAPLAPLALFGAARALAFVASVPLPPEPPPPHAARASDEVRTT